MEFGGRTFLTYMSVHELKKIYILFDWQKVHMKTWKSSQNQEDLLCIKEALVMLYGRAT
jgi:hypothetical protein